MASHEGPHLLFVYGTLKRGQHNNHLLSKPDQGHSCWVGAACTVDKWPLIVDTSYNLPFLLDAQGQGQVITGDVYRIDDVMLGVCDGLEWYPDVYERPKICVRMTEAAPDCDQCPDARAHPGDVITTWAYVFNNFLPELLNRECYGDFNLADHTYDPGHFNNEDGCLQQIGKLKKPKFSSLAPKF